MVARALLRERFGRIEIPARHAGRRWLPCSGVHPPLGLSASFSSSSDLGPDGGQPPLLPALSPLAIPVTRVSACFPGSILREPESFSMLSPAAATVQEREAYSGLLLQGLPRRGVMGS
jgi:hypothetical protein